MKVINSFASTRKYTIYIEPGIINAAPGIINSKFKHSSKVLLITDENIFNFYSVKIKDMLESIKMQTKTLVLKSGESSKSLEVASQVYDCMLEFNMHRDDLVIAFGGGVIGDLAGFAASTFHRGTQLLQFPTTIIAQVDSSIGGKVVVNHGGVKNVIGSFYQPHAILIDPELLETLEEKEIKNGLAEIIKYGLVFDKKILSGLKLLAEIEEVQDLLTEIIKTAGFVNIIARCVEIKTMVVKKDEFDTGYRNLLNFGHTAGHAIEKIALLEGFSHGLAVAIGMVIAIDISIVLGLMDEAIKGTVLDLYNKLKLTGNLNQLVFSDGRTREDTAKELVSAMKFDKKFTSGQNRLVLLKGINRPVIKENISEDIITIAILKNFTGEEYEKDINNKRTQS